jgi:hypothetical protein
MQRNEYTSREEKIGGADVKLSQMQKTFMKSSIAMRKQKTGKVNPAINASERDAAGMVVEVLDAAAYSALLDDVDRPLT